jgi:hypothetical protein
MFNLPIIKLWTNYYQTLAYWTYVAISRIHVFNIFVVFSKNQLNETSKPSTPPKSKGLGVTIVVSRKNDN